MGSQVTSLSILRLVPDAAGGVLQGGDFLSWAESFEDAERRKCGRFGGRDCDDFSGAVLTSLNPVFTIGDQILEAILLHQNA